MGCLKCGLRFFYRGVFGYPFGRSRYAVQEHTQHSMNRNVSFYKLNELHPFQQRAQSKHLSKSRIGKGAGKGAVSEDDSDGESESGDQSCGSQGNLFCLGDDDAEVLLEDDDDGCETDDNDDGNQIDRNNIDSERPNQIIDTHSIADESDGDGDGNDAADDLDVVEAAVEEEDDQFFAMGPVVATGEMEMMDDGGAGLTEPPDDLEVPVYDTSDITANYKECIGNF